MASAYKATPTGKEPREGRQQGRVHAVSGTFEHTEDHRHDLSMGGGWFWDRGSALPPPPTPLKSVRFAVGDIHVELTREELADLWGFLSRENEAAKRRAFTAKRLAAFAP